MVDLSQFLTGDGTRIDFARVGEVSVGAVFGAIFTGWVGVILGLADVPIGLLGGLAEFLGDAVVIVAGLPSVLVERGFAGAVPFVLDAGPAGYVVAIGIVLVTLFTVEVVVSRVR